MSAFKHLRPWAISALLAAGFTGAQAQGAARVDGDEISVHQVNFVIQQQRDLKPDGVAAASRQILEKLIDQQVVLQVARKQQLASDPRVQQQIEAATREIISRAYIERLVETAAMPSASDIDAYFKQNPALFSERRVYSLQEINIEARPEQLAALRSQLGASKDVGAFVEYLKTNGFRYAGNQTVRAAEQLPMTALEAIAKMTDGQAMFVPAASGAQVLVVVGSRSQPISSEQARPAIEQFLLNASKRSIAEAHIKALRAAARVEYLGPFAEGATPPR